MCCISTNNSSPCKSTFWVPLFQGHSAALTKHLTAQVHLVVVAPRHNRLPRRMSMACFFLPFCRQPMIVIAWSKTAPCDSLQTGSRNSLASNPQCVSTYVMWCRLPCWQSLKELKLASKEGSYFYNIDANRNKRQDLGALLSSSRS